MRSTLQMRTYINVSVGWLIIKPEKTRHFSTSDPWKLCNVLSPAVTRHRLKLQCCRASVAAPHLYQNQAARVPRSRTKMMQNLLKCYAAPCFISLPSFFPFMRFMDNGEALAPKVLSDFFTSLLWRQKIDFIQIFLQRVLLSLLQIWPTNTMASAQKCTFAFTLRTFSFTTIIF